MAMLRIMVMGAGAAGAAAVAFSAQPFGGEDTETVAGDEASYEICLKSDLVFFEGVEAQCFSRDQLRALHDAPVADLDGDPVTMTMAHPSDISIAPGECRTCRDYREMTFDGWFAPTARDMRREGYFVRACGVLRALTDAAPAQTSFFTDGSLSDAEAAALAGGFDFGEARVVEALTVEKGQAHQWRMTIDSLTLTLQELANADFDNDGVEEILAFTSGAPEGGSAVFYDVGLIEKDKNGATPVFTPFVFGPDEAAGAAG